MSLHVLHRAPDAASAAERAAELFAQHARAAIAQRGRFHVALAGGSSPAAMHRALASRNHAHEINWSAMDIYFGDERAAQPDSKDSNYGNARATLLDHVPIEPARVHPMRAWDGALEARAREYDALLRAQTNGDGALDLLVLGVGEDAHILSLYPGCPCIDAREGPLVAALRSPPMNPPLDRLTLTPAALFATRAVLLLIVGPKKRAAWRALDAQEGDARRTPIRLLRSHPGATHGAVHVVGDAEALDP